MRLYLFLLALAGSAAARPTKSIVKESIQPPRGWTRHAAAPANHIVKLRIALPHGNFQSLEETLYAVSDPENARYGAHLSKEDVDALLAPSGESVEAVNEWLAGHEIEDADVQRSAAGDWVTIRLPVSRIETMLNTKYHIWKNADTEEYVIRTTSYSLPGHLHKHIELIQPTTMFGTFRKLKTTIHSIDQSAVSPADPIMHPTTGLPVDASCNRTVTVSCLKQIYNVRNYVPLATSGSSIGITGYLDEYANRADLQTFYKDQVPAAAAANATFAFVPVAGGVNPQDGAQAGIEANLDVQFAFGLSHPIPATFYSTPGVAPFIPDAEEPTDTNEPYMEWLEYISSHPKPPLVISTSYGDNEQTVPESYARRVCESFGILGARGVSIIFSSGDGGVGDGESNPAKQQCFTNDGKNQTQFMPGFPASCPFVTAVGGTYHFSESGIAFSGGGFSNYFARPSYQDTAVNNYMKRLPSRTYYGLFNRSGRAFPDVSAQSYNFRIFVDGTPHLIGGTSASAPAFAALVALLNDARLRTGKPPLGFLNPWLYSNAASGLNDIVTGSNPGCGTQGFNASVGWDPVTGLGTPNFGRLLDLARYH
ncbi:Peptidase S53 domain-containing protein [Mycena kentingensis (nom. inval.)]|nr:Peptidase S53 domain-containing protein [Mycena kentingensis (nom. inval.)]